MEFIPFAVQGLLMGIDEFQCHRQRPLKRWERLGHPLDTLSFSLCLAWLMLAPPGRMSLIVFAVLCLLSCLLITKDEWQHKELATAFENWLHALLFMLHPVVLIWAGHLWWTRAESATWVLPTALILSSLFLIYQIVYWNFWRHHDQ